MPQKMTAIQIKFNDLTALLNYSPGAYFLDVRGYPGGQDGKGWRKVRSLSVQVVWTWLLEAAADVEGPNVLSAGIAQMKYGEIPWDKRDVAWARGTAIVVESTEEKITAIYRTEEEGADEWAEIEITV